MEEIHFIGLGNMGLPMILNLKKKYPVKVFDIDQAQCDRAKEAGVVILEKEAIGIGANVIITALPEGEHLRKVVIEGKLGEKPGKGKLFIDCSTVDRDSALAFADYVKKTGHEAVDSPMSGGIQGARSATLTFMLGGSENAVNRARPILECMGRNIFHAGDNGAGQAAKACNNMLLAISMVGTCEALNLGSKLGIDPLVLSEIMKQSSGNNWVLQIYNPWPGVIKNSPASKDYVEGFKSNLMLKDLDLAEKAAADSEASIDLGNLAHSFYKSHCDQGNGELDFSSILRRYLKE